MVKKYDLLKPTILLKNHIKLNNIIKFVTDLFDSIDVQEYFMSLEMTLTLYNFTINSFEKLDEVKHKTIVKKLIESIYEKELTENELTKLENDIKYIISNKLYCKISHIHLRSVQLYNFFFQTTTYILNQTKSRK